MADDTIHGILPTFVRDHTCSFLLAKAVVVLVVCALSISSCGPVGVCIAPYLIHADCTFDLVLNDANGFRYDNENQTWYQSTGVQLRVVFPAIRLGAVAVSGGRTTKKVL